MFVWGYFSIFFELGYSSEIVLNFGGVCSTFRFAMKGINEILRVLLLSISV